MKSISWLNTLIISAAALAGCSAAGVLNSVTPSSSFDRFKNVHYGDLPRQSLDVYRAAKPKTASPVIVFVYGGSWSDGKKSMYKFVAEGFTKDGYDVVVPDYRLFPDSRYPDMVVDTGRAVQKAAELFPNRPLVLMGHSAGAYNVLMSAMAPEISGVNVCGRVAGIISLAAPTGAYPLTDEPFITIFPDRFRSDDAPINRAGAAMPETLLINGADDTTVGPENAVKLGEALAAQGRPVTYRIYPGLNHIDPVRVLSRHFDGGSTLKGDLVDFIDKLPKTGPFCR